MKIRFIGTGSGMPDTERRSSSILVEGSKGGLLIDAGEGVASALRSTGVWNQDVQSVILTHAHADHVSGLNMLLQGWYLDGRKTPLDIHAPLKLIEGLISWMNTVLLPPEKLPFAIDFQEIKAGNWQTDSGHSIESWQNGHINDSDGGSYSLAININRHRWIFSSDIKNLDIIRKYLDGADCLIVESFHISHVEAVELAREFGIKNVYLTHIPPECNCEPVNGAIWTRDDMVIEAY